MTIKEIPSLREILSTRSREFPHKVKLTNLEIDRKEINDWCMLNCIYLYKNYSYNPKSWEFSDDRDATLFILKWL
jgi:hypothetical protein